jgi:hypothetical protein
VNDLISREALLAALAVGALLLIAYQGLMLWWTKKTVGRVPPAVLVLRVFMLLLLVGASALVIWKLAG